MELKTMLGKIKEIFGLVKNTVQRGISLLLVLFKNLSFKLSRIKILENIFRQLKNSPILNNKLAKIIMIIVALYLLIGAVLSIAVFQYHSEKKIAQNTAKFYYLPVIWVNWQPITLNNYYFYLNFINHYQQKTQQENLPDEGEIRREIINRLIDNRLIKSEAERQKVKISSKDIEDTYQTIIEQADGEQKFKENIEDIYGLTPKQFKILIKDNLYLEKLFMSVNAQHILIKDENIAKEVLEKVKKQEKSFEDLAKEYSEDSQSRDKGGQVGWIYRGQTVKEFEEAAFSLESNQIKEELVKSEYGYHIIKVLEKKGKISQSSDQWLDESLGKAKIWKWLKI